MLTSACKVNSGGTEKAPFKFTKKTYQEYVVPFEGKKGITLHFQGEMTHPNVYFESVFLKIKRSNYLRYLVEITLNLRQIIPLHTRKKTTTK